MAASRAPLADALADRPVLLDGGLASELEAAGQDLTGALWSGRVLRDDPAAVASAHGRFFAAGAQVATTASYQISYEGLAALGFDRAETDRLLRLSVTLASAARATVSDLGDRWVAASVGPYGATLADGSEYRGDYGLSVAELRSWHRPRLAVLADAGADVLALETIPCLAEVEALLAEVDGTGVPCWLSVTCGSPSTTRAGEPVAEAFAMAGDVAEVIAVGVNCVPPDDAGPLVATASRLSGKPGVVYPNRGEQWDAAAKQWRGSAQDLVRELGGWLGSGARLVGGCCRVLPREIALLRAQLDAETRPAPEHPR
ncbi:MAG TPA: homocysteine S-methyltransferase [Microlunatus sp.]|nr:homocysteine S-methyltransferase [Microlunatus sp.]